MNISKIKERKQLLYELCNENSADELFVLFMKELDIDVQSNRYQTYYVMMRHYLQALIEDNLIEKYTFDAHYNAQNSTLFKYGVAGVCFAAALYIVFTLIVVIFAGKLAKALEKCQSPFEESVTKAMKHFAFSLLIPLAFMIAENGILNLSVFLAILAVIIFSYIFSYGAKLQQESDETL